MNETKTSAYIQQGTLCLLGVHQSPWGPIPFAERAKIETVEGETIEEGPVDFGKEQPAHIQTALDLANQQAFDRVTFERLLLGAEELVLRSRAGDQNAMATISMIRKNAARGNERAQLTLQMIKEFIGQFPVQDKPQKFGAEQARPKTDLAIVHEEVKREDPLQYSSAVIALLPVFVGRNLNQVAVLLSNGADLLEADNPRISAVVKAFPQRAREMFELGMQCRTAKRAKFLGDEFAAIGYSVGRARTIQGIRSGKLPIADLDNMAAWELGE